MTQYETKDSGQRAQFESGMQRDTQEGKPRFDLTQPLGIPYEDQLWTRFAALMGRGAEKYTERNWEQANSIEEMRRMKASALRHFMQWYHEEDDEDHAAAVLFNIMAYEATEYKRTQEARNSIAYRSSILDCVAVPVFEDPKDPEVAVGESWCMKDESGDWWVQGSDGESFLVIRDTGKQTPWSDDGVLRGDSSRDIVHMMRLWGTVDDGVTTPEFESYSIRDGSGDWWHFDHDADAWTLQEYGSPSNHYIGLDAVLEIIDTHGVKSKSKPVRRPLQRGDTITITNTATTEDIERLRTQQMMQRAQNGGPRLTF